MLTLSQKAKEEYAKYVGPDGKLIIDESLPDDVKEAFKFFNEQNIDIMNLNVEEPVDTPDEPDNTDNDYDDDDDSEDYDPGELIVDDSDIEDDGSEDISSLENLF